MNCLVIEGGHSGRCNNSISLNHAIFVTLGEKSVSVCDVWAVEVFIYLQKSDNTGVKRFQIIQNIKKRNAKRFRIWKPFYLASQHTLLAPSDVNISTALFRYDVIIGYIMFCFFWGIFLFLLSLHLHVFLRTLALSVTFDL